MTLSIEIDEQLRRRLQAEAQRRGVAAPEYARQLLEQGLSSVQSPAAPSTLDLLAEWDREDDTSDPAELARRRQDVEELKAALNENRMSGRTP